jgi:hypothetical protein
LNLHGLNPSNPQTPTELQPFGPTVFWTDQGNSPILYDAYGNVLDSTSCGGGGSLNSPCANPDVGKVSAGADEVTVTGNAVSNPPSTLFNLQASPNFHLYGTMYQPRGDTLNFQGSGTVTNPLQIITGTLVMQGTPTILQPIPTNPLIKRMVALVE